MRSLLIASLAFLLCGCASLEGAIVIGQSRAGVSKIAALATAGDEESVKAIPAIATDVHDALGIVLMTDYGQESLDVLEYSTEAMRVATADLRDAHRNRSLIMDSLTSIPYVGPGISWATGIGGMIVGIIGMLLKGKVGKKKEG